MLDEFEGSLDIKLKGFVIDLEPLDTDKLRRWKG